MRPDYTSARLSGWGRTAPSVARTTRVDVRDLAEHVKDATGRGVIVRGLGRSYGDPAQNSGGTVLTLAGSVDEVVVDDATGVASCPAGVSLDELLRHLVPRGWFVPVTPGTRFVTVGGAVASDIHGKNHHFEGSFGNHVRSLRLMLADGTIRTIGPDREPRLFWATVGGMGLTGAIIDVDFSLLPIETSMCRVETTRCRGLDELLLEMSHGDEEHRYSVAWVDLQARGRRFGRSVLWRGDHARVDDLSERRRLQPLAYAPRHLASVPPLVPSAGLVNGFTSALFNELWFRKEPRRRATGTKPIPAYFHPLDAIGGWNRLYGRGGFVQYQFVVPFEREDALREVVRRVVASRLASPLIVLKRFGPGNPGPLSFPMEGWTLTVDMPTARATLGPLLHDLDSIVLDAGGRHYLAKDAHTTPDSIRRGYPRLDEWLDIRRDVDPDGLWQSDLARRLELVA